MLYLRISHDPTGQALGVARQEQDDRRLAEARRIRVSRVFCDNDITATGRKVRPDFELLLNEIDAGRVKVVIAWHMDRITRNARDYLRLTEAGRKHGLIVMFVNGPDLDCTSPISRAVAEIMAIFARLESETKSLRQARANLQRAQAGQPHGGGTRPYGYEDDAVTVRALMCPICDAPDGFTADPVCVACGTEAMHAPGSESDAIARGCLDALAGVGSMQIARDWNDLGLRTQLGNLHGAGSVRRSLTNPHIAGIRTYNGEEVATGSWAAIVAESTWRAVCAVYGNPARSQGSKSAVLLLSGIGTCPVCTQRIERGGTHNGNRRYRCPAGHMTRKASDVDTYVIGHVVARLSRPDAHELLAVGNSDAVDVGRLQIERTALHGRQGELAAMFARGKLTAHQLEAGTDEIAAQVAEIDEQIARAGQASVLGQLIGAEDVLAAWNGLDLQRQRAVVKILMDVVVHPPGKGARVFDPKTVTVTWKPGYSPSADVGPVIPVPGPQDTVQRLVETMDEFERDNRSRRAKVRREAQDA